jgi:Helix-turn-helix domain
MAELPELMTRREVAGLLRVSQACLCRWARSGVGPRCLWLSATVPRYRREDVLAFLAQAAA